MFDGILGSIAGPIIGGLFGMKGQEETNAAQMMLAQNQMDFQREMSSTAYQRAVEDMKKAGLNPMLAYSQGGASTPGGAMATLGNPNAAAVNSAAAAAQVDATRSSAEKNRADADKAKTEADLNRALMPGEEAQLKGPGSIPAANINAQTGQINTMVRQINKQIEKIGLDMDLTTQEINRIKAAIPGTAAQSRLAELEIPRSQNLANVQGSWYMRNIAPYLPDFLKSVNTGFRAYSLGK